LKSAILITARLKSTRLPLKVIKPIEGIPMIVHMLNRLKLAKTQEDIIICTSTVAQDDPLEEIAYNEDVKCFRGHPDDVLVRLKDAAEEFNVETVINCTADNPFVDPEYVDKLYFHHIKRSNDFSKIQGLPFGAFSYALSKEALTKVCNIKNEKNTENWHEYFLETDFFKWDSLVVTDERVMWEDLRLTVDYPEDFEFVQKIFEELWKDEKVFSLSEIVKLCRLRPDLVNINRNMHQKKGIPIAIKKLV